MTAISGDIEGALGKARESAELSRAIGDEAVLALASSFEGYALFMTEDLDGARVALEEALALTESGGDQFAIAGAQHSVAQVARLQGRHADAARHYRRAIELL
jgi:hypothetical protein